MEKLVSILIPTYNRSDFTIEAIESAIEQDYSNIEIIVVDNNSEEIYFNEICNKFKNESKVRIFKNEKNLGPVGNWKSCLDKSKGYYVKFLWSDDLIDKSFVSKCVKQLDDNPDASFAYTPVILFEDKKNIDYKRVMYNHLKPGVFNGKKFIKYIYDLPFLLPVSPGCAVFRKEKVEIETNIENNYGYNHNKTGAGTDLLIFLNSVSNNEKYIFINEPLSFFRAHNGSITISDSSIKVGYLTAKLYFLQKNNFNLWNDLNYEIINDNKEVLNIESNLNILKKYYGKKINKNIVYYLLSIMYRKIRNKTINILTKLEVKF